MNNKGPFLEWSGESSQLDGWGPINATNKFIFVHIPKTAGVSVASSLGMPCIQCHNNASTIQNLMDRSEFGKKIWQEYFKFSFVRNPWSWVISSLFYHAKVHKIQLDVREFLNQWMQQKKIKNTDAFTNNILYLNNNQYEFLSDDKGRIIVDFVGKFENLQQDFDYICDKISIPRRKVPHQNQTEAYGHYAEYYNEETKEFIAKKYAKDIEYFGYKFDN